MTSSFQRSPPSPPKHTSMPLIRLTIVGATGLRAADMGGASDPYVIGEFLNKEGKVITHADTFKTTTQFKTLSPTWNETFLLGQEYAISHTHQLRLRLMDYDTVGGHDSLGEVVVDSYMLLDANTLAQNGLNEQVSLDVHYKQAVCGQLHLRFAEALSLAEQQAKDEQEKRKNEPNLMVVRVRSATELVPKDKADAPYNAFVVVTHDGKKHDTSVQPKTNSPQWFEKFPFAMTDSGKSTIQFEVRHSTPPLSAFVAKAELDVSKLKKFEETEFVLELRNAQNKKDGSKLTVMVEWTYHPHADKVGALQRSGNNMMGMLNNAAALFGKANGERVEFEFEDVGEALVAESNNSATESTRTTAEQKAAQEEAAKEKEELLNQLKDFEIKSGDYQVHVNVMEARDLAAKDACGTSDPFVSVEVLDQKQRTGVKEKTLECSWDELLIFQLRSLDKQDVEMGSISIKVMDANTMMSSQLIGATQFDLSFIYSQPNHRLYNVWVGLTDPVNPNAESVQGFVRLSITVLGPGDKFVPPKPTAGEEPRVLMPSNVEEKVSFLCVTVYEAEELPQMDSTLISKGIDAYVTASISNGPSIRTKVITKKGERRDLKAKFNEQLMLVLHEPVMAAKLKIGVIDSDRLNDEMVGHFYLSLQDIKDNGGHMEPFWANIYGAPLQHTETTLGESIEDRMNRFPDMASTYRGRVLLGIDYVSNENLKLTEVNQKRRVADAPQRPGAAYYGMSAQFVQGCELPSSSNLKLVLSCGLYEIESQPVKSNGKLVTWSCLAKSTEVMKLPSEPDQIPDVFLYLVDNNRRICYKRFKAADLLIDGFKHELKWMLLQEDQAINALDDSTFPGTVLVSIGFGLHAQVPNELPELDTGSNRATQVRVHVYQGRNLPAADSNGLIDPYLSIRCGGERPQLTKTKRKTRDPVWNETIIIEDTIPTGNLIPQLLVRVMDHDDIGKNEYAGMVAIDLADPRVVHGIFETALNDEKNGVTRKLPEPDWYPLMMQEPGDCEGELLLAVEVLKRNQPFDGRSDDLAIPNIEPKTRTAFLELTILGLRDLEPFQFMPIQMPYIEFQVGGDEQTSHAIKTEKSKRPSGRDPNYLQRIVREVTLPEDPAFAPRMSIVVKDTRLGGFQTPIIGSASIDLATKIPWGNNRRYRAPGHALLNQPEGEPIEEDEPDENSHLLGFMDSVDNGAGVFGALKELTSSIDPEIVGSKVREEPASDGVSNEDYLSRRDQLAGGLEDELKTSPWERYTLRIGQKRKTKSILDVLNPFSNGTGKKNEHDAKIAGYFKGLIRILEEKPEEKDALVNLEKFQCPHPYEIRVYVLKGYNFAAMDPPIGNEPGRSDPYLKLTLGNLVVNDRKNFLRSTLKPAFHRMFRLNAMLPGASTLKIEAFDHDYIGGDDLIGSTEIDLEDRLFHTKWLEMGDVDSDGYRYKPVEMRELTVPPFKKETRGHLKLWVDILTEAHRYKDIDISLPPPMEVEVRLVIWKARNLPCMDELEGMNDLFFRAYVKGAENKKQETDIHWRAKQGNGSFNYRLKFPVTLTHELFEPDSTAFKELVIQALDKDIITADDYIGDVKIPLEPYFREVFTTNRAVEMFPDTAEAREARKKSKNGPNSITQFLKLDMDERPPDSEWKKLGKGSESRELGEVSISISIVPKEIARQSPVGLGRSDPNNSPYLPPPAGRLSFTMNPFQMIPDLVGDDVWGKIRGWLCCMLVILVFYFLAPFINLAVTIATRHKMKNDY